MQKFRRFLLIFAVLELGFLALERPKTWAAPKSILADLTVGVELTAIPDLGSNHMATDQDAEKVAQSFAARTHGSFRRDGSFFFVKTEMGEWTIHLDHGAVEVATPVMNEVSIESSTDLEAAFEAFAENGLHPEIYHGGQEGGAGHMHFGRNIFDRDPVLLRNLWVDFANRPWLQTVFEEIGDAVSIHPRHLLTEPRDLIERTIRKLDFVYGVGRRVDIAAFAGAVPGGHDRSMAINLLNIVNPPNITIDDDVTIEPGTPTIEMRFLRAPVDAEQVRTRFRFFKKYFEYLERQGGLIPIRRMAEPEIAHERLPSVARRKFIEFIKEIDPAYLFRHLKEWNSKYAHPTMRNEDGSVEMRLASELREKKSYEIKVKSAEMPRVKVRVGTTTIKEPFDVPMAQLEPGVWVGSVVEFASDFVDYNTPPRSDLMYVEVYIGPKAEMNLNMSGTYRSQNHRIFDDENRVESKFIPTCEAAFTK